GRERSIRGLAIITLISTILWSMTSGYIRYALYLELAGGILLVCVAAFNWQRLGAAPKRWRLAAQLPLCLVLLAQGYYALRYVKHWEWSQRQPIFTRDEYFRNEYTNL